MKASFAHTPESGAGPIPPGARYRTAGWRDPRMVFGVILVASSVLLGSLLFARADDTTLVWGLRQAVPAGTTLASSDLEPRRVTLDAVSLDHYLPAAGDGPVDQIVERDLAAGELLPLAALSTGNAEVGVRVPLAVGSVDLPAAVQEGDLVDVWVTERDATPPMKGSATRAFAGARVVALSRDQDSLSLETTRSVVVLMPGVLDEQRVGEFVGQTALGRVILTQSQGDTAR